MTSDSRELSEKLTASGEDLILILDRSKVGNAFEVLMVSVSMGGRAGAMNIFIREPRNQAYGKPGFWVQADFSIKPSAN